MEIDDGETGDLRLARLPRELAKIFRKLDVMHGGLIGFYLRRGAGVRPRTRQCDLLVC
jgi:hypothetical protein